MKLLGDRNWYLPSWLEWLPRLDHEGRVDQPEPKRGRELGLGPIPEPAGA
jgi:RND superfamily putative drug exporter